MTARTSINDSTSTPAPKLLVIEPGIWPLHIEPDPRTLLVDPEFNIRGIRLGKGFVDSIRENGVLQTIVAVRTAEGHVKVRMGNRRTLGAVEAERPTVPVVVIGDESTDSAGEIERITKQYVENKHRDDMTEAEEIGAMVQLTAFGVSPTKIAKKLGLKNGTTVRNAVKVHESTTAMEALSQYKLDLTEAVVVGEFEDDPEAIQALMSARLSGQFDHVAQQLRDERTRQQQEHAFIEAHRAEGVRIVEDDEALTRLSELIDDGGQPLTPQAPGVPRSRRHREAEGRIR